MTNPLVSIVLTNYNGEKYVGLAIESVLAQTYQEWELIVVDDASTDQSLSVIRRYADPRIRILELPENQQVSYAHNIANRECRGSYIAAIDNDDIWAPEKLEKQVQYMEQHPETGVCFTYLDLIDQDGKPVSDSVSLSLFEVENRNREEWLHELLTNGNHLANDSSLIRTSVMRAIGENDLCLLQLHDYDMWLKIPQIAEMYILQEPLVHYRTFSGSGSISQRSERNDNRSYFEYSYLIGQTVTRMEDALFLKVFRRELVNQRAQTHTEVLCEKAFLMSSDLLCTNVRLYAFNLFQELFSSEEGKKVLKETYGVTQHQVYTLTGDEIFLDDQTRQKIAGLELEKRRLQRQLEIEEQYTTSLSWRVTEPVRRAHRAADRAFRAVRAAGGKLKGRLPKHPGSLQKGKTPGESLAYPKDITFSILVPLYNTPVPFLQEMIRSVQDQTYGKWELCLADGSDDQHPEVGQACRELLGDTRIRYRKLEKNLGISGNTNACLEMASGEYIALFDHDDLLLPEALEEVMQAICRDRADFIYTDEAVFLSPDRNRIITQHFKPDFAYDDLLSNNYICHLSVFSRELIDKAGPFRSEFDGSQDHELILRLTGAASRIVHIPKVLYLWRSHPASVASDIGAKMYAVEAGKKAVQTFLRESRGISAYVDSSPAYPSMYHVHYAMEDKPAVDLIMDLKDPSGIGSIQESLATLTLYRNFRIRFVTSAPCAWKKGRYDGDFVSLTVSENPSRSARLRACAEESRADLLLFMEEGIQPLNIGWMEEMVMLASQKHIGAVGAKIMFRNDQVRHAGLILGLGSQGLIGRNMKGIPRTSGGYFGQLAIVEDVSAVSCECMMVSRERYLQAGGFSEQYQDVLFDADLCLRLGEMGLNTVYTPFAEMEGGDAAAYSLDYGVEWDSYAKDAAVFRQTWGHALALGDPFYNPNFSRLHEDYRLK